MALGWTKDMVSGHDEMDRCHHQFLDRWAAFRAALEAGAPPENILSAFCFAHSMGQSHGRAEERLMVASGYPWVREHAAAHTAFEFEMTRMLRVGTTSLGLIVPHLDSLEDRILRHFQTDDLPLAAHACGKGVASAGPDWG